MYSSRLTLWVPTISSRAETFNLWHPPSAATGLPANIDHVGVKRWWTFGTLPIGPGGW